MLGWSLNQFTFICNRYWPKCNVFNIVWYSMLNKVQFHHQTLTDTKNKGIDLVYKYQSDWRKIWDWTDEMSMHWSLQLAGNYMQSILDDKILFMLLLLVLSPFNFFKCPSLIKTAGRMGLTCMRCLGNKGAELSLARVLLKKRQHCETDQYDGSINRYNTSPLRCQIIPAGSSHWPFSIRGKLFPTGIDMFSLAEMSF